MKIRVWIDQVSHDDGDAAFLSRLVGEKLHRFANRISRVEVAVRDVNGRKGGIDKLVRLTVHLTCGDVITLSQLGAQVEAATGLAAERLESTIAQALERRQRFQDRRSAAGDPYAEQALN